MVFTHDKDGERGSNLIIPFKRNKVVIKGNDSLFLNDKCQLNVISRQADDAGAYCVKGLIEC